MFLEKQHHIAIICSDYAKTKAFYIDKLGFRQMVLFPDCGFKFGRWLGLIWLEKRLKSVEIPTSAPTPWPTIRKDAQNFANILDNLSLF